MAEKGKRERGRRKGCLNHTTIGTVSSGSPGAHSIPSARTKVPVERPPAERYTRTSPAPVVPARASKEISALHLLYPFLPPHSPHGVSLSPQCTPDLPSPPSSGCPHWEQEWGGFPPTSRGAGNWDAEWKSPYMRPYSKQGRDQVPSLRLGFLLPKLSLKLPKSAIAKPIP